ncbi:hypothetical protein SDC9_152463 [bioreactor metagenome]|uniref:Uncharacterized protein n=1 Tax=bioreactor metagenome TaxID=1076179 RepID=A0A645EXI8_9ZZZZ
MAATRPVHEERSYLFLPRFFMVVIQVAGHLIQRSGLNFKSDAGIRRHCPEGIFTV